MRTNFPCLKSDTAPAVVNLRLVLSVLLCKGFREFNFPCVVLRYAAATAENSRGVKSGNFDRDAAGCATQTGDGRERLRNLGARHQKLLIETLEQKTFKRGTVAVLQQRFGFPALPSYSLTQPFLLLVPQLPDHNNICLP